jgi:Peptidase A4 family
MAARISPLKATKMDCPDCWAGYGDSVGTGEATGVSADITVPTLTPNCASGETGSTQLVALDGSSGSDFALAGIEEFCVSGTLYYYSVFYNGADGSFGSATVSPGDAISMSITESAGTYTFTVTDNTNPSGSISGTGSASGASLNYATCFNDMLGGIGQANFGTITFTSCTTTINGSTNTVGTKGVPGLTEWLCFNSSDTKAINKTGKLNKTTGDFTVTFKKSGP